jgi:prepilin-type N-terminal cleavage/methylation domain-containing protein
MLEGIKNKKGQTLTEVMIALTILVLALSGTFILIINVVALVLAAQNRTEAITLVQKGLSEGKLAMRTSCSFSTEKLKYIYTDVEGKTLEVTAVKPTEPPFDSSPYLEQADQGKFLKLISTVSWTDKGNISQSVTATQIVRTSGE